MWTRGELKARAKAVLRQSYWKAFLVSLVLVIVGGSSGGSSINWNGWGRDSSSFDGMSPNRLMQEDQGLFALVIVIALIIFIVVLLFMLVLRIFVGFPLEVGGRRYFKQAALGEVNLNDLGYAFQKGRYGDIVKAMLWRFFINLLWCLLLIVPGIVKMYAYRMVPYILADNPNIGYKRALELSNRMTAGQKFAMFVLDLSFIGWYLLGALAFVVGMLFVQPYENATKAELYLTLRQDALDSGECSYAELNMDPYV